MSRGAAIGGHDHRLCLTEGAIPSNTVKRKGYDPHLLTLPRLLTVHMLHRNLPEAK